MRISFIVLFFLGVAIVALAFQDASKTISISLPFLSAPLTGNLPVVLIGTLLLGFAFGVVTMLPGRIGAGLRARRAKKKLEQAAKDSGGHVESPPKAKADTSAPSSSSEADEMQRLADEVAKRTEEAQQSGPPPLTP